jgi:hypothetical protein
VPPTDGPTAAAAVAPAPEPEQHPHPHPQQHQQQQQPQPQWYGPKEGASGRPHFPGLGDTSSQDSRSTCAAPPIAQITCRPVLAHRGSDTLALVLRPC